MQSRKILAAAAAAIVSFAGVADAAPVLVNASGGHKEIVRKFDGAELVQVRSAKRVLERREVATPGDEIVGYVNENGDELIGRADGSSGEVVGRAEPSRSYGAGGGQVMQMITGVLGGGNTNYYPPQPRANAYQNSIYAQCPQDYSGRPSRECVSYIQQRLAANNAAANYGRTFQCPGTSGIAIISRTYRPGCVPLGEDGLYHGDGYGDY